MNNKKISYKGIVRNKTDILLLIKQSKRKKGSRFSKQNIMGENQLAYELTTIKKPLFNPEETARTMTSLPPQWIDHYQQCKSLLLQIQDVKKQMMTYQSKRFMVVKESEQYQLDGKIYDCATQATKKIKKCEKILEKIQNQAQLESQADHKTCKSVCYKLAVALQQKTRQIRGQQRAFVEQRKNLDQSTRASFLQMAAQKMLQDDDGNDMLQQQRQDLDLDERNKQILKIVESIYQLNGIYKELNNLVIMQGSLLDRIDYNIEQTFVKVVQGNEHLQKAQKWQKKTSKCGIRVMILMLITIGILAIILIVRWTKSSNNTTTK